MDPTLGQFYSWVTWFSREKQPKATEKGILSKRAGAPQICQSPSGLGEGFSPVCFVLRWGSQGSLPVLPLCVTAQPSPLPRTHQHPGTSRSPRAGRGREPAVWCPARPPHVPSRGGRRGPRTRVSQAWSRPCWSQLPANHGVSKKPGQGQVRLETASSRRHGAPGGRGPLWGWREPPCSLQTGSPFSRRGHLPAGAACPPARTASP